jgi:hypothetical protein
MAMHALYRLLRFGTMLGVMLRGCHRGGMGGAATGLAHSRIRIEVHKQLACNFRRVI